MAAEIPAKVTTCKSGARDPKTRVVADAIARLQVWHRPEPAADDPCDLRSVRCDAFAAAGAESAPGLTAAYRTLESPGRWLQIRTCQREVRAGLAAAAAELARTNAGRRDALRDDSRAASLETFSGTEAYRFLVELGAGLHSAIPGETNVFGQMREAWRRYELAEPMAARALGPLIEVLFRDVRAIRTRYLQGIGGQSYATLARRLLEPDPAARVLVVGFGALGRSMPDKFAQHAVAIFARRPERVAAPGLLRFGPGEERAAAAWATHVVMCVPQLPEVDAVWLAAFREHPVVRIVHLGCRRRSAGGWRGIAGSFDLDDVFDLQREQARLRHAQLLAARAACATLAEHATGARAPAPWPLGRTRPASAGARRAVRAVSGALL